MLKDIVASLPEKEFINTRALVDAWTHGEFRQALG